MDKDNKKSKKKESSKKKYDMEKLYEESFRNLQPGSIVDGTVVKIKSNDVLIDVGYKAEGAVSKKEFDNPEEIEVGDTVRVLLQSIDASEGLISLSKRKADYIETWSNLKESYKNNETVNGYIKKRVKGGFIVSIGVPAFLPASHLDLKLVKNLNDYVGKNIKVKILKMNKSRKNIVVSRKAHLKEKQSEQKEKIDNKIYVGAVLKGTVKNITDFGAFIDLGGVDGLLHINDISWKKISHPSELLSKGDEVKVKVTKIEEESNKISLSLKELEENPWDTLDEKFNKGDIVEGKVISIVQYGAFIEIAPGVEGLAHISEMSWQNDVNHPSDVLEVGEKVEVKILDMDIKNRKISLGIKQVEGDPWDKVLKNYSKGDVIEGEIKNITSFGAFVEIVEGIEGLLHISDIAWERIDKPEDVLTEGDNVEVKILNINESERKIALGRKQLIEDPWSEMKDKYQVGDTVEVEVIKTTSNNAIVKMENGVQGFIAISQLDTERIENVEDVVDVGDKLEVKIIKINKKGRKVDFSIKALKEEEEEKVIKKVKEEAKKGNKISLKDKIEEQENKEEEKAEEEETEEEEKEE
ncbi:MAG TPA: 30S ribosomal protein S1 [Candidatus Mcinerneyibacterium sp.]|nr:30S ribosomal protein S1 [Candidatus Mcinerneyibacterium sp.]